MKKDEESRIEGEPLTVEASAKTLGVSVYTIRAWLLRRRLGHLKLGRSVRIPRQEIDRLLRERYVPPRLEHPNR